MTEAQLIITCDRRSDEGKEAGAELWRVPFDGWGAAHELRAEVWSVPRRYAVVRDDGRMLADGYTSSRPELLPGEPFRIRVEERTSPRPPSACGRSGAAPSAGDDEGDSASPGRTTV